MEGSEIIIALMWAGAVALAFVGIYQTRAAFGKTCACLQRTRAELEAANAAWRRSERANAKYAYENSALQLQVQSLSKYEAIIDAEAAAAQIRADGHACAAKIIAQAKLKRDCA